MYLTVSPYQEVLDGIVTSLSVNEGLIKLTGPTGTGKTALCDKLNKQLLEKGLRVVHFLNPPASVEALQTGMRQQLGLTAAGNFTGAITDYLTNLPPEQRSLVVLVDDAHELDADTFNALRMLCNIQDERHSLIKLIVCGHDSLNERFLQPEYRALAQHLGETLVLPPMSLDQLRNFYWQYWRHHDKEVAVPSAKQLKELLKSSGGLPGAVMQLLGEQEPISIFHARSTGLPDEKVVKPGQREKPARKRSAATDGPANPYTRHLAFAGIALLVVLIGSYVVYSNLGDSGPSSVTTVNPQSPQSEPAGTAQTTPATTAAPTDIALTEQAVEPATTLAVTAAADTASAAEPAPVSQPEIETLLNSWTSAWQQQDLSGYFAAYDPAFAPANGQANADWQAQRQRSISNAREIVIRWHDLAVVSQETDSVVVELWLDYASATYRDSTLKQLQLRRDSGALHIVAENNLRVERR